MRSQVFVAMAVVAGISAWAGDIVPATARPVMVCMQTGLDFKIRGWTQPEVSKIFAEIAVQIDWRRDTQVCVGRQDAIVISVSYATLETVSPRAWAYALPYEGIHITVFYDRVQRTMGDARAPLLLAYVLAHEIGHILQGVARHSETGIMKAAWDYTDYFEMGRRALVFTPEDVRLIHAGVDARNAHMAATTTRVLK